MPRRRGAFIHAKRERNRSALSNSAARPPRFFNLGLPRTGTTWFSAVTAALGLKSLHCNEARGCHGLSQHQLLAAFDHASRGYDGAGQGRGTEISTAAAAQLSTLLSAFDTFSDVPWFAAPLALLPRLSSPTRGTEVFITTRGVSAWLRSFRASIIQEALGPNSTSCFAHPLVRYAKRLAARRGSWLLSPRALCSLRATSRHRPWEALFYEHHSRVLAEFPSVTILDLSSRAASEASVRQLARRAKRKLDAPTVTRLAAPRNARIVENGRVIRGVQRSWSKHDF